MILTGGSSGIGLGLLEGFLARFPEARAINLSRSEPPLAAKGRLVHLASALTSRAGRDDTTASSDIARTPLRTMRASRTRISTITAKMLHTGRAAYSPLGA